MMVAVPRPIPAVDYTKCDLSVMRSVSQTRAGNRVVDVVEYADPVWMVTLETFWLERQEFLAVETWWDSLRDGFRPVLFREMSYVAPLAHREARGPEATAGTLTNLTNGNILAVSGVSAGLVLSPGDYVSLAQNGRYALGRVVEASGGGTSRTIEVEPVLPLFIGAGAQVLFDRAQLLMRPVAGSFQKNPQDIGYTSTFQLIESRV